ncbi:MAG: hypothetical protein HQM00_06200, partial [Magnetococcales bacterium]|nr:hypothetical protein [Magnetococcales bacterium]
MIKLHSLGVKILTVAGMAGTLALLAMGLFAIHKMERSILQENIQGINQLTIGVLNGLESIMLGGDAEMARNLSNRLKGMKDLESFRILRLDGTEAFLERTDAPEENDGSGFVGFRHFDPKKVDSHFTRAVTSQETISYNHQNESGEQLKTYLIPVLNKEPC